MATVKQIIEMALREIVALTEGEEATADMIVNGMEIFAQLLASWSKEGLMIPYITRETLIGDPSKASYSWGPGGDINSVAPIDVSAISFQIETWQGPLRRGNLSDYLGWRWLGNVGYPTWFYYEKQSSLALLHFDIAPFGGAFQIASTKDLLIPETLVEDLEFPAEYSRMIRTNLAIEFCPQFDTQPSPALVKNAMDSKNVVQNYNAEPVPGMTLDTPAQTAFRNTLPWRP